MKCKTSGIDPKFCTCIICQPPRPVPVRYVTREELEKQYPTPPRDMHCRKCPAPGVLDFVSVNTDAYRCRHCGELTSGLELIQRKP